jgi:hypothetical protein
LCGPQQLRQKLPYFGEYIKEELRDYLVHQNGDHKNTLYFLASYRPQMRNNETIGFRMSRLSHLFLMKPSVRQILVNPDEDASASDK